MWEAIKYENFVPSFKNVLAVEAQRKLSKLFDEEQWYLKREIQEMIQQEKNIIENEIMGGQSLRMVEEMIGNSKSRIQNQLMTMAETVE